MRTDVKVGLVCVFAVVLAVVCYFTLHDKSHDVITDGPTSSVAPETPIAGGNSNDTFKMTPAAPTTAPSAAVGEVAPTPMLAANTGGSLLGPSTAYGQILPPPNNASNSAANSNLAPTVILPPGAATNPSSPPMAGGSMGLTPPSSMNTPLIPSPSLSTPGGGTSSPGLSTSPLTPAPMEGSTSSTSSILPPSSPFSTPGNNTLTTPGDGLTPPRTSSRTSTHGSGAKPRNGTPTIDLTSPTPSNSVDILGGSMAGTGASYAIQKGDTLGALAKRNGVSVKSILAANPGVNPNRLKVGQKINIPAPGASASTRPSSSKRNATTRNSGSKKKSKSRTAGSVPSGSYTVKKGDTLRKIAKSVYGDEQMWRRIFRTNRGDLASPNDLTVGQVIKLPAK